MKVKREFSGKQTNKQNETEETPQQKYMKNVE